VIGGESSLNLMYDQRLPVCTQFWQNRPEGSFRYGIFCYVRSALAKDIFLLSGRLSDIMRLTGLGWLEAYNDRYEFPQHLENGKGCWSLAVMRLVAQFLKAYN